MLMLAALLLILLNGYATQRGNICAVAAMNEVVRLRRAHRFTGFLLCAALSLVVICIAEVFGVSVIPQRPGAETLWIPALGGAVFAMGTFINGKCAFGTVARLGAGELSRLGTILGFLAGATISTRMDGADPGSTGSVLAAIPPWPRLAAAVLLATALAALLRWILRDARASRGWPPALAMSIVGIVNGLLIAIGLRWPYTTLLIDLSRGAAAMPWLRTALAVAFVLGAAIAAAADGIFKLHFGTRRAWLRAIIGGVGMGIGAALVPGGNDAMLLLGLPLLLPNLLIGYATMNLVLFVLIRMVFSAEQERERPMAHP